MFCRFQDVFQSDAYCAYDPTIFKKWFQGGPEVDQVLIHPKIVV